MPTKMSSQERERRRLATPSHMTDGETGQSERRRHKSKRDRDKKLSMPLEECRRMYKNEVLMLWRELDDFRRSCKQQMDKQKRLLLEEQPIKSEENSRDSKTNDAVPILPEDFSHELKKLERNMSFLERNQGLLDQERQLVEKNGLISTVVPDLPEDFSHELKKLERNMNYLERNQGLLDQERQLVEKEENLARRHEKLRDYEKEVEEAEAMLTRRQSICDIRTKEVETLNEDLLHMKHDITDDVDDLDRSDSVDGTATEASQTSGVETSSRDANVNSPEASAKARRHWTLARRHMLDKVTLLEGTVQRYRTQLASATATVTAKDLLIARLNKQITDLKEELQTKVYRLKQMESQLSITTEEKMRSERNFEQLMEELQNIDLGSSHQLLPSPQVTPKHNGQAKVMRKQNSTFSFFSGGSGGGESGDKNVHTNNFKEVFKRRILNVHVQNSANTGTPRRKSGPNHAEGNGDARYGLGHEDGNNDDSVINDEVEYHGKKRVIHGYRERSSTSSESGSKACSVM